MSKIALVDDDRNILTSVSMTLEAEGFEVETYNDGQSALDAFNRRMPDMAVLDIKMPRMDGMDLLQRLRQKSAMPVIFLTSKDDEIDEVLGLRMGADDYVKKPFSQRLLVERIRALLRRQDAIAGDVPEATEETKVMVRGNLTMDPLRHAVTWKSQDVALTVTEFLLLQALAQRPGFVKSRDQLMDVAPMTIRSMSTDRIDRQPHFKRLWGAKEMRAADDEFSAIETLYRHRFTLTTRLNPGASARKTFAPRIDIHDSGSVSPRSGPGPGRSCSGPTTWVAPEAARRHWRWRETRRRAPAPCAEL